MQASIDQVPVFGTRPFLTSSAESTSDPNSSGSSTTGAGTVTANDFLELLVTEMKNQDPTANTDPNEYISQLVQVNSLEQLVQINQDLGSSTSTSNQTGASGSSVNAPAAASSAATQLSAQRNEDTSSAQGGNLSQPSAMAAATRVADSLQVPSLTTSAASRQNLIPVPGSYPGSAQANTGTSR